MSEEELVLIIVAIVFGTGFAAFIMYNIFSLIRAAIERKNPSSSDLNPQFFRALADFKKTTERRLNNVEAILTDLEEDQILVSDKSESTGDIEIEDVEQREEVKKSDDGNLRNMLNE
ncbi:MAG: hypothetical protein JJ895_06270 [Balneolaceae bacterium]|nr:hypothetical protein [Balneolaceae bacterium]